jgi:hypothetical protein
MDRSLTDFVIRPDDRLVASCCRIQNRTTSLQALPISLKRSETQNQPHGVATLVASVAAFDRPWIERRLFEIEGTKYRCDQQSPQDVRHIIDQHSEHEDRKCAGIIVLGEVDQCIPMMQNHPFTAEAKIPKETQIFQMVKVSNCPGQDRWECRYLGNYTPSVLPLKSDSTCPRPMLPPMIFPPMFSTSEPNAKRQKTSSHIGDSLDMVMIAEEIGN